MSRPKRRTQSRPYTSAAGLSVPARSESASVDREARQPETQFFRDLVASLRNGVLAIHRDGRIAVMNDVAYRILGLSPQSSDLGRPFGEVLGDYPDISRILGGAFELEHLPNRAEVRLKTSGKVIGYTLSRIYDARGTIAGAALFFKDLTRVEQLEERERLRDRLAALGEMAAAIAHEVKNPLAGIEVMAGVLKRQLPDSKDAQSILNDIITEVKMANAIVVEVLEFVRPIRLQVEHVCLPDVMREAVAAAETRAVRGGVAVTIAADEDVPPVEGDAMQLRQLFTNLVTNAFEALGGRGAVRIESKVLAGDDDHSATGEPSPRVVVEVADDGPGLAADAIDRIFSPFFTTKPRGSGLGLAIVRKIVDAHDGHIDISSQPGAGTCFRVTLPVAAVRASQA